jgi:hypothetical protein
VRLLEHGGADPEERGRAVRDREHPRRRRDPAGPEGVLYVDGKFVGGCDIVTELHQSGELSKELAVATPAVLH